MGIYSKIIEKVAKLVLYLVFLYVLVAFACGITALTFYTIMKIKASTQQEYTKEMLPTKTQPISDIIRSCVDQCKSTERKNSNS